MSSLPAVCHKSSPLRRSLLILSTGAVCLRLRTFFCLPNPSQNLIQRQFPPAGVLGALRVALTILDDGGASASETTNAKGVDIVAFGCGGSDNGKDTVTFETALGRTVRSAVSAPDLTWEMAARVLERPFR